MSSSRKAHILEIPVTMDSHQDVLKAIARRIEEKRSGGSICITNTESMYHALRNADHMAYIQNAEFSLCDGVGVIAAGYFWGLKINRYNGPILQLDCSEYGQSRGWRHFYYGGKEGVAEMMATKLKERFPQLNVVGTYCPPFRALTTAEDDEVVAMINAARPDIVWVGLGLLKQEIWVAKHMNRVNAAWIVPVGAAFDYHSGAIPWAPAWMRALGLEWVFRLIIQPKLRAQRYWWSLIFVTEAALAGMWTRLRAISK